MSKKSEIQDFQQRLTSILEAVGEPVTTVDLQKHPLLSSLKLDGRAIGAHLRSLFEQKKIRKLNKGRWGALHSRTAVTTLKEQIPPKLYFVLIPSEQKILLDVGGMRLPVVIE